MSRSDLPFAATTPAPRASARPSASFVRLGSLPASSEQDLRLIQDRLSLFGLSAFLITAMFLIAMNGFDLALRDRQGFLSPAGNASHAAATLAALSIWLVARSRRLFSPAALSWLDVFGTVTVCLAFAAMGHFLAQPFGFYTALLAILHVNVGRAAIVPSVASRTLGISALAFAGVVLSRATVAIEPSAAVADADALRVRWVGEALLWSTAGAAVATLASQVIYGLHERALEARRLGQYELEEKIGEGGMGQIYRARHAMLRRPTAIKLVVAGSEDRLRRFEREVQLTARLTHPNTISIYDYGRTPDGTFYYAMELLEGLTVEQVGQRHGPQPPARVIHLLEQACGALVEAHGVGLIHRDIKPANLFLCRRGGVSDVVKVLDFGLVRELQGGAAVTSTNVDAVVGTPLYMSPEAIVSPDQLDARADLYGLGAVGYFLLTGAPPFEGKTLVEICGHHLHTPAPAPSRARPVPRDLERIILRCLEKDPKARPPSAAELAEALRACRDAGKWTAADAERWWASVDTGRRAAPAAASPAAGARARCVALCAVDLKRRLAEVKERA